MGDNKVLVELKRKASNLTLLYVEDNKGLQKQAKGSFKQFFGEVFVASNGKDGLKLFKENRPNIIVTDIQMPLMDGLEMSEKIKKIDSDAKIIITTAYNTSEYLLESIRIGIYRYITKPMPINNLAEILLECTKKIQDENNRKLFDYYLKMFFSEHTDLIILFDANEISLANDNCLKFFDKEDTQELKRSYKDFGDNLLPNENFLYNHEEFGWMNEMLKNPDKPFNAKISDNKGEMHHFILKMHPLENNQSILAMNDITELGLLKLFDTKQSGYEIINEEQIKELFEAVKSNNIEIKVHNFYKGLSIAHPAEIIDIAADGFTIKSRYIQQKAIQYEKKILISCDIFPADFQTTNIKNIDFEQQSVLFAEGSLIDTSPTMRKQTRVEPSERNSIVLYYDEHTYKSDIKVIDISINAIRFRLPFLPAGFEKNKKAKLRIYLDDGSKQLVIDTDAKVYKSETFKHHFEAVMIMKLSSKVHTLLVDYIAKRQMSLIREFKSKQFSE